MSEEADGAYWLRGVVTPPQAQGVFLLIGLNSDEVMTYGVGYKCSDKMKVVSEFTSGTDSDGNDIEKSTSSWLLLGCTDADLQHKTFSREELAEIYTFHSLLVT